MDYLDGHSDSPFLSKKITQGGENVKGFSQNRVLCGIIMTLFTHEVHLANKARGLDLEERGILPTALVWRR